MGAKPPGQPLQVSSAFVVVVLIVWSTGAWLARFFGAWLALGATALLLGSVVLFAHWLWRDRGALSFNIKRTDLAWGGVGGAVMVACTFILYPILSTRLPGLAREVTALYSHFRELNVGRAVLLLPLIIAGEEFVWRETLQGYFVGRMGRLPGVVVAAVAYGLVQLPAGSPVLAAVALCCGLGWGAIALLSRRVMPAFIAHLLWDFSVLIWYPLA